MKIKTSFIRGGPSHTISYTKVGRDVLATIFLKKLLLMQKTTEDNPSPLWFLSDENKEVFTYLFLCKIAATILGPTTLCLCCTGGSFLAIADRAHAAGRDSGGDQIVPQAVGTALTEGNVIFLRSPIVTVSGDHNLGPLILLEPCGIPPDGRALIAADIGHIKVEVNRLQRCDWLARFGNRCRLLLRTTGHDETDGHDESQSH